MTRRKALRLVLSAAMTLACAGMLHAAGRIALVDAILIDGTGSPPVADAEVLIDNGIIRAAGPAGTVGDLRGYQRVSLGGAYLLPGFINAHVHSTYNAANLKVWLAAGVTSVRDEGYLDVPDLVGMRDTLNADPLNARVVSASPMITRIGGYGTAFVRDRDSARSAVRRFVKSGVDLIKIAVEDDLQGRQWAMLGEEEIRAIVEAAHAAGKRVSAHVSHRRNLSLAVNAGVDDIAHMVVEPISAEEAAAIARKGILWVPTLELWKGVSEAYTLDWLDAALSNTGLFFKAGGKVALGTDYNGYTTPFDSGFPLTEAKLLLRAGLSPMDVIVAGTRNAAEACGKAAELGTVTRGRIADLLVVRESPLESIEALAHPVQVYKSGTPVLPGGTGAAAGAADAVPADTIASLDVLIPRLMREQHAAGLAVAITSGEGTLWSRGYGRTDFRGGRSVDTDTLFSLLPLSGAITATAVMMAGAGGLVDLDAPLSSYLPEFTVNSAFENHPEGSITLRRLLNHTAGLAEEAPYGNNASVGETDFEKHIGSISSTWLRFPVGGNWAYSNLGLDLAGYVLQQRSSTPFPDYMKRALFAPLGMARATIDAQDILSDRNRATGHQPFIRRVPQIVPMSGAGGIYASAKDAAAFVRFHLARGSVEGRQLLDPAWLDQMYALGADGLTGSAGLGVFKSFLTLPGHNRTAGYTSNGGGFGFLCAALWYPRLGIGGVALSNTGDGSIAFDVVSAALNAVIDDPRTAFHERLSAVSSSDPEAAIPAGDPGAALASDNADRLKGISITTTEKAAALRSYEGDYHSAVWGQATGLLQVRVSGSSLTLNGERLYETQRGLFFAADGEVLDLRGPVPTWRNSSLSRFAIPGWQWILAGCGMIAFVGAALATPVVAVAGRRGRRGRNGSRPVFWTAFGAAAALVLACGLLSVALAQFPYFIGDGMPALTPGVPLFQGILILTPEIILALACVLAGCAVLSWRDGLWSVAGRVACSVLAAGAVLITASLAVWRLMGI